MDATSLVSMATSNSGATVGHEYNQVQIRPATLSVIEDSFPEHPWIQAYTDGSAPNAVINGGVGV